MTCWTGPMTCWTGPMTCWTGPMTCWTGPMTCWTGPMTCWTGPMTYLVRRPPHSNLGDDSQKHRVDSIRPERLFSINERTLAERSNLPEKRGTESTRLDPPFPIFLYKIETPKLGSKDTLTRDTIRPPTQISKYDSGGPTSVVPKSF
ncbi:hypothetical protein TNCV_945741 [Trichonephila clavipes]|nr:hypothetical protein TNCV_945741 [Trichonephila clavipes]